MPYSHEILLSIIRYASFHWISRLYNLVSESKQNQVCKHQEFINTFQPFPAIIKSLKLLIFKYNLTAIVIIQFSLLLSIILFYTLNIPSGILNKTKYYKTNYNNVLYTFRQLALNCLRKLLYHLIDCKAHAYHYTYLSVYNIYLKSTSQSPSNN